MSKFTSFTNPRYADDLKTLIDIDVTIEHLGNATIAYTVHLNNPDDAELWRACQIGAFGVIGAYVPIPDVPAVRVFDKEFSNKQAWMNSALRNRIAKILGTIPENLNDYEAKLTRLTFMADRMRVEPSKFYNSTFNGIVLGAVDADIVATANAFIDKRLQDSALIDAVTEQFHVHVVSLGQASTIVDLDTIDWPV